MNISYEAKSESLRIQEGSSAQLHTKSTTDLEEEPRGFVFWSLIVLSQLLAIACVVLIFIRYAVFGGAAALNWNLTTGSFGFHPTMMILSLVAIYGDAILVYRVFRTQTKLYIKFLHGAMHLVAMFIAVVGLIAIIYNKNFQGRAHFTSLHSMIGIFTFSLFCVQWLIGFCSFLLPLFPEFIKAKIIVVHTSLGTGLFTLAIATCFIGMNSQLGDTVGGSNIMKALAFLIISFGGIVLYLLLRIPYKRPH